MDVMIRLLTHKTATYWNIDKCMKVEVNVGDIWCDDRGRKYELIQFGRQTYSYEEFALLVNIEDRRPSHRCIAVTALISLWSKHEGKDVEKDKQPIA